MKKQTRNTCNIIGTFSGSLTIIMILMFSWEYLEITKATAWIWVISAVTFIFTGMIVIIEFLIRNKEKVR